MADACRAQGAVLTGGETSIQPGVVPDGEYVLSASAVGVVDKAGIIDGSDIVSGDAVLAVASNGLHTNGYTLVRALLEMKPELERMEFRGESFLDVIMRPHKCYYRSIKDLFNQSVLKGLAHITGGGIQDNIARILPADLDAIIDLARIRIPEVFKIVRREGNVADDEMLRTFNMGVGLVIVTADVSKQPVMHHLNQNDCECYEIGRVEGGKKKVGFENQLLW